MAAALSWSAGAGAAEVKTALYGVTQDGRAVHSYTLINDRGASATILTYGGAIADIHVPDREGRLGNVVMSFPDVAGWEFVGHANSLIGRYANRIRNGFTLDGTHYPLQQNALHITQHSGPPTFSTRVWKAEPVRKRDGAAVTLTMDSPDGDQGFPGHMVLKATYRLSNDNALRLDFVATTDKPTVLNPANHIYFNLNGNSTTPIFDHDLQIIADRVAAKDPDQVPTGEILPVAGTPFDFNKPTVLSTRMAIAMDPAFANAATAPPLPAGMVRTYDHSIILAPGANRLDRVAARLHDPASGRVIELRTTETTIQLYTPATRNGVLSETGKPFTPGPAIALETEHLPDSPNHANFPSTVLRPGQTFRSTTIFAFSTDRPGVGR
jgi:aldose 1-epimerase